MITPNIEELIARIRSPHWSDRGDSLLKEAVDALQSQAERIKELDAAMVKRQNAHDALFIRMRDAEEERDTLRAQLAALQSDDELPEIPLYPMPTPFHPQTHVYNRDQMQDYARQAQAKVRAKMVPLENDAERMDWIQSEYIQVDTFAMPTGGDDADVGWTLKQWHCGERVPRLIHEHFKDDLRAALDAAMGITG